MAINLISNPNSIVPAFNQIIFDVSSTNASQPNFNFLADIYIDSTRVSRIAIPKQPSVNTCLIDASPILKNFVKYDFLNLNGEQQAMNLNSRAKYKIEFRELFDVSGAPIISSVLKTFPSSGTDTVINSIFDFEDFTTNVLDGYNVSGFGFLTETPEHIKIEVNQDLRLSYYDPNNIVNFVYIDNIPEDLIALSTSATEPLRAINIRNIIDYLGYNRIGTHTVTLANSFVLPICTLTFEIIEPCSKYETIRLHWLNKLGGFDSYNFTKQSLKSMDIDRKQFKKMQSINYSKSDRLKTNYNTTITDKLQINSDWISDEMADWFQGLLTSPIVYLERGIDNFIAVNITNSNYLIQNYLNARKLHNLQLEIEYSYNRYTQSQ